VGPVSEKDIAEAESMNAILFGFDVAVQQNAVSYVEQAGVTVHLHKLIYKFQEDLEALVADVNRRDKEAFGRDANIEVVGQAHVQQIFQVTEQERKGVKKMTKVAGSRVEEGVIDNSLQFRVLRNDEVL
jgi:translation initiation factor IF-2